MEEVTKYQHMHEGESVESADDVKVNLEVTLAELYNGVSKEFEIERTKICEKCDGLGAAEGSERMTCEQCDGKGRVLVNYGFIQTMLACDMCDGKGKVIANQEEFCIECHGEGTVKEKKKLVLPLSKDMRYGAIKIPGEGNQARDRISGGCIVIIRPPAKDPSDLKLLRGNDLFLLKDVTLVDALLGIKFVIDHINGKKIACQVESKFIVSTGDLFKLVGMGMPNDEKGGYGDLLIQFNIIFPTQFSDEQREHLIKALGTPTEIPNDLEPITLTIEKTAADMQKTDEEEEDSDGGDGRQTACVQQ